MRSGGLVSVGGGGAVVVVGVEMVVMVVVVWMVMVAEVVHRGVVVAGRGGHTPVPLGQKG